MADGSMGFQTAQVIPPKVSILIPTRNRADYLSCAIKSALSQDYEHLEVIVSDNASQDETPRVVNQYARDARFRYLRNENDIGMVANWRRLLYEYATGEWFVLLSDDDYFIDNHFVSACMDGLKAHPDKNIVLIGGGAIIRWEPSGIEMDRPVASHDELLNGFQYFLSEPDRHLHLVGTMLNCKLARSIGMYSRDINSADTEAILRMALEGDVLLLHRAAGVYRMHGYNEYLAGDPRKDLEGAEFINSAAASALSCGYDRRSIKSWEKRMTTRYLGGVVNRYLASGDRRLAFRLLAKMARNYSPWNLFKALMRRKNLFKLSLLCLSPRLLEVSLLLKRRIIESSSNSDFDERTV